MLSEELFHKHLRVVLNHLYNRDILRENPLVEEFSLAGRADPAMALQHIISDAIEALKPPAGEPLRSEKRRNYEILMYRYIEQFKQDEVAHNIDVSIRQFRREQDKAIEVLMLYLWKKFHLDESQTLQALTPGSPVQPASGDDWDWMRKSRGEWVSNPPAAIEEALKLIQPVAGQYTVSLDFAPPPLIPDLAVHPIAFRQILLNLIRMAIDHAPHGNVALEVHPSTSAVEFHLRARPAAPTPAVTPEADNNLMDITAAITAACAGKLKISTETGVWQVRLTLPVVDGIPVLVIDDNKEIIDLLKRYSTGSRYRISGTGNPEEAINLAISSGAQIVVMDVMMPRLDGWELLGRFRQHPATAKIPLIVLSILAQKELALALGAKALMVKPIKQETFLSTLDQVFSELPPGRHTPT
jgi:CheY-like chemotaxis protein